VILHLNMKTHIYLNFNNIYTVYYYLQIYYTDKYIGQQNEQLVYSHFMKILTHGIYEKGI